MIKLKFTHKFIIYIPLRDGKNKEIPKSDMDEILNHVLRTLIDLSGGATMIDGIGYWKDEKNSINTTDTKLIMCYFNDMERMKNILINLALWVKKETNSKAICYEIDDGLYMG
ncbi:hypothetical protein IZY60_00750 [Lutibacter sp. B2]|nr:hypothetical protein [Lutibacter sp. B2]